MHKSHVDFEVHNCGLIIDPAYPYLGASPDGIVNCKCCGRGLIEVKCPYLCRDSLSFEDASKQHAPSAFCLQFNNNDGTFTLRPDHAYHYQVQLQMKLLCKVHYCYFVVWSPVGLVVLKIDYDKSFAEPAIERSFKFFKLGVLPELIGKWYTCGMMRHVETCKERSRSLTQATEERLRCQLLWHVD